VSEPRFEAKMALHADQGAFGWLVAIAFVIVATPGVLYFQRQSPATWVWLACFGVAGVLVAFAMRHRAGALHDVTLLRDETVDVLRVLGPDLQLELRGNLSARPYHGNVVTHSGRSSIRMPTRILIVEQKGAPKLVLEEPVSALTDDHEHWPDAGAADLAPPSVPALTTGPVVPDLETLRRLLSES
jgi:hypothetical protein